MYSFLANEPIKDYFTTKNLSKILLKNGKENLIDILDFKILTTKNNENIFLDLKKYFLQFKIPNMPIKANYLIEKFKLKEGKLLGSILKEVEEQWVENNFEISNDQVENIVKSKGI